MNLWLRFWEKSFIFIQRVVLARSSEITDVTDVTNFACLCAEVRVVRVRATERARESLSARDSTQA